MGKNRFTLLDTLFFHRNGLAYKKDEIIGDGYFINNKYVKKYLLGFHSISMKLYLQAIHRGNYYSVLRRKVLELYYLNDTLYYDNHSLFVEIINNINNLMRITTGHSVKRDIPQFIDDVLDEVDWDITLESLNSIIRYFKPMSGMFDFDDRDSDTELDRYRAHINKFNGELKTKDNMNKLHEAITELGSAGEWINPESISERVNKLFEAELSSDYIIKLIREFDLKAIIKEYNMENYGTVHERTKATVEAILDAAERIRDRGEYPSPDAIAMEADIHLKTLNRKLDDIPMLYENLGWG